ncbi:GNAT family N-acetyltransferase [Streptomyces radicis]|uniref:Lysine N-acyltransferase MbtK n=2 Tax=Streptomyces radicis TaxID=1750517 RepID=A0A3A9VSF0_9ACTN|nr:GNAT family N-acetyltransferase [Streptomyces radicis]RKN14193.1 GNAT family N-acetyltransferase [Streptomyces radicis]
MSTTVFSRRDDRLGEFTLRPVDPTADAELLHGWLTHEKSAFWLMAEATIDDVAAEFRALDAGDSHEALLGLHEGRPAFLVERYDPAAEPVGAAYDVQPGDIGMHVLVAPTASPVHGFTRAVLTTVMELLFADPATQRVVVEPDIRNTRVHALNAAVGFRVERTVTLPGKDALLSMCTREQYAATKAPTAPHEAVAHLTPDRWERANRLLIRKALAEFSHERLLTPERSSEGRWSVPSDDGDVVYRFSADVLALDHWAVDAESVVREHARTGTRLPLDALDFVVELRASLGLGDDILPVYLEEISSTLAGTAYKLAAPHRTAAELARADFQAIEAGMTEGHPCFVANNGRLGFDAAEYHAYAPETGSPVRLVWLAARRDLTTFTSGAGLDYATLIAGELAPETLARFADRLRDLGLDPDAYHLFPVHPWQWYSKLAVTFAAEVARRHLVPLGRSDDHYRAQQSIRTFFNAAAPHKHYVKTALSVLNMGFVRGLSAAYMKPTPAINDWLADLVHGDELLASHGFRILRERAAIGYHHKQYEAVAAKGSPYLKMLAALWRESPVPLLAPGERLATMASLLHVDRDGGSVAAALIAESGLPPATWLRQYLDAYLTPLLHCLYAHDVAFMPHGENVIMVLRNGVPRRVFMKDIAEEIAVMNPETPLPPEVERIRIDISDDLWTLTLFTDVFDCFFRFLNAILASDGLLTEDAFWSTVAACVTDYQKATPHLAERHKRFDLFQPRFDRSCLNRLQLRNNQQMVDLLGDPDANLAVVGTLDNPLAAFA